MSTPPKRSRVNQDSDASAAVLSTTACNDAALTALKEKLETFVRDKVIPAEKEYEEHMENRIGADRWTMEAVPPCVERLKIEAKCQGLWNLFLPHRLPPSLPSHLSPSKYLSNVQYATLCEIMGHSFLAPEVCNCNAPDTGNMEVLLKHGTRKQQDQYLKPLLEGEIRSAFLMTEPDVASSDATNIETKLTKTVGDGGAVTYFLSGRKWWSTGAMDPRCKVAFVLAKMDYSHPSLKALSRDDTRNVVSDTNHGSHTVVIVPIHQIKLIRPLTVFGYDDAPHGHAEVSLPNISLPPTSLVLGEGRGFEIAQSRLGPGRIHHCMRAVGLASRCYQLMLRRTIERSTFGHYLHEHGGCQNTIADAASDLEAARLLTLSCAHAIDSVGADRARDRIAGIKVSVPRLTMAVVDRAVQVFGGAGVSGDFPLARALAGLRTLRIADGPDAVHRRTVAKIEVRKAKERLRLELKGCSRL